MALDQTATVVSESEIPEELRTRGTWGWVCPLVEYVLRPHLPRIKGEVIVINDATISEQVHESWRLFHALGTALHELAHIIEGNHNTEQVFGKPRRDIDFKLQPKDIEYKRQLLVETRIQAVPKPEHTLLLEHNAKWMRICANLSARCQHLADICMPTCDIVGYSTGFLAGRPAAYTNLLTDEPARCLHLPFSAILSTDPPTEFTALYQRDLEEAEQVPVPVPVPVQEECPVGIFETVNAVRDLFKNRELSALEEYEQLVRNGAAGVWPSPAEAEAICVKARKEADDLERDVKVLVHLDELKQKRDEAKQAESKRAAVGAQIEQLAMAFKEMHAKHKAEMGSLQGEWSRFNDIAQNLFTIEREIVELTAATRPEVAAKFKTIAAEIAQKERDVKAWEASIERAQNAAGVEREHAEKGDAHAPVYAARSEYHKADAAKAAEQLKQVRDERDKKVAEDEALRRQCCEV